MAQGPAFLGLDFGTESVRAVVIDPSGRTLGARVERYTHGQIVPGSASAASFFPAGLPSAFALQHPLDWIESAAVASRGAIEASGVGAAGVAGVGVDFTSCTMLPCRSDGTPLCVDSLAGDRSELATDPHAWPKLWKHHGALHQTERLNAVARAGGEPWLARYGGVIGLEWLWPKVFEAVQESPSVARAAEVWLEAGDWFVWQLVGAPAIVGRGGGGAVPAASLPRSTCQAGYKGLWSPDGGWPSEAYLGAVDAELAQQRPKVLLGRMVAPGVRCGGVCAAMAARLGVAAGTPVSAAVIDAHAGVPGAGVGEAGTLVMVMGTSACHMLLGTAERTVPGVAGVVRDGILPGFFGYETGQAAFGDGFDLVRRLAGAADFTGLEERAAVVAPGAGGLVCLDWFNGCRTPLMDGALSGAVLGLRLGHGPEHVYRAALEGAACGLRWIVDTLREGGVPVERFVATGGLPRRNRLLMEITASVLEAEVSVHPAEHGPALGAAILASLAAGPENGGYSGAHEAVEAMAGARSAQGRPEVIRPRDGWAGEYQRVYRVYRAAAEVLGAPGSVLRTVRGPAERDRE